MDAGRDSVKAQARDGKAAQRARREDVLARQKAKRAETLAQSRGIPATAAEDGMQDAPAPTFPDTMDTATPQKRRHSPAEALMSAEWMVDLPPDLTEQWFVAARPAGRRCLVVASGGITKSHGRSGKPRTFPSALPSGSRATRAGLSTCELDCIYREADSTYFVVDVLGWKGQAMRDCPSEFRLYWLSTKLAESRAHEATSSNPCRFVPLAYAPCTPEHLQHAYSGDSPVPLAPPPPPCDSAMDSADDGAAAMDADGTSATADSAAAATSAPWRDGLLFLHREALYEAGASPLLLSWSDAHCSSRFYDYGSSQMAGAISADPSKAERWRTAEVDAAVTYAEVVDALQQPPMLA